MERFAGDCLCGKIRFAAWGNHTGSFFTTASTAVLQQPANG